MSGTSISEYSSLVSAGVQVAGLLCGGIAALWGRLEYTNRKTQKMLRHCEAREVRHRAQGAVKVTVIELLWQEVKRLAPNSEVLRRARRILDDIHRDMDRELDLSQEEGEEWP